MQRKRNINHSAESRCHIFAGTIRIPSLITFGWSNCSTQTQYLLYFVSFLFFTTNDWNYGKTYNTWKGCEEQILRWMECTTNHMPLTTCRECLSFFSLSVGCVSHHNRSSGVHNSRPAGDEQNFGLVIERRVKNFPLNKDEDFSVCSEARNH